MWPQGLHAIKRRKEIWEALHPVKAQRFESVFDALGTVGDAMAENEEREETEVGQVAPPQFAGQLGGARPQTKSFAADTAALTGEDKRTINRHLARAEALGEEGLPKFRDTYINGAWAQRHRKTRLPTTSRNVISINKTNRYPLSGNGLLLLFLIITTLSACAGSAISR